MANNGTIQNTFRNGYRFQIYWEEVSKDIGANKTQIRTIVQLVSLGSAFTISSSVTKKGSITIDGIKYDFDFNATLSGNQTKNLFTKVVDVTHGSDGNKICSLSSVIGLNVTLSGTYWGNITTSGGATLNAIPRTSDFTLSNENIVIGNTTQKIKILSSASEFSHRVTYKIGSYTSVIQDGNSKQLDIDLIIPESDCQYITNSMKSNVSITVDTYNGASLIGTKSSSFIAIVPDYIRPTFSEISAEVLNDDIPSEFGYVKGRSRVRLTIVGEEGKYGSTIRSFSIKGPDIDSTFSTVDSGVINTSGNSTFTASVTDSRGARSDEKVVTIFVKDYSEPTINSFTATRSNSEGLELNEGNYLKIFADYSFSDLGVGYMVSSSAKFKRSADSNWGEEKIVANNAYEILGDGDIAANSSYEVQLTIQDSLSVVSRTIVVGTSFATMDFKKGGKGIAIGKLSEIDMLFDIGMDTRVFGSLTNSNGGRYITGDIGIESGTDLNDILETGLYNSNATVENSPTDLPFSLAVIRLDGTRQILMSKDNKTWQRDFSNGEWTQWAINQTPSVGGNSNSSYEFKFGYWGLMNPDGNTNGWIRTTSSGLLPYQSGVTSGIGSAYWRFNTGYFNLLYANRLEFLADKYIEYDASDKSIAFSSPIKTSSILGDTSGLEIETKEQILINSDKGTNSFVIGAYEWSEQTLYPTTERKGNIGTYQRPFSMVCAGSLSDRMIVKDNRSAANVAKYDNKEYLYNIFKDINIFMANSLSQIRGELVNEYETKLILNPFELPQELAPKNKPQVDYNASESIELFSLVAGLSGALSFAINKLEQQEEKILYMEEIIDGFTKNF